jgi:exonuclease III
MKIATYNVRNLFDPGTKIDDNTEEVVQEGFFAKRLEYIGNLFSSLDLDIICLQEIGGELGVKTLGEKLGYRYFFAKPNKRGIRMAVLYKAALADMISCESVSFGELSIPAIETRGDTSGLAPILQRREILEITLRVGGKIISINTFHLKSNLPQYFEDDDMEQDVNAYIDAKFRGLFFKTMELCALRRHVETRLHEGKEIILLGDYNETNIASIMDILVGSQNREQPSLYDLLVGYEGDAATHIHRGKRLIFDTIIVSSGIKDLVKGVRVENSSLKDYSMLPKGAVEHELESDHALVWTDLKIV